MSHQELISCVFTLQYAALKQMGTCPIDIFFAISNHYSFITSIKEGKCVKVN